MRADGERCGHAMTCRLHPSSPSADAAQPDHPRFRHRRPHRTRVRGRLHRADRRNRRRQVDPDRCAGTGAGRARRRAGGAPGRGARRNQRRVRHRPRGSALERWLGDNELAGDDERLPDAARDRRGGRSRGFHQRPRRDAGAVARSGRVPGRHPRPARAPVAAAAGRAARAARCLRRHWRRRPTRTAQAWRDWQRAARAVALRSKPMPRRSPPNASSSNGRCANSTRSISARRSGRSCTPSMRGSRMPRA